MKISSKSILSPGRAGGGGRDPPNSLSTSLSRRLKNSGSIKGGASPAMFPTTAKKRGSFENPEPSSPKVTCIGQVRVKSKKKQAKKLRTLSRNNNSGEVSFKKLEKKQHQQSWPAPGPEPALEQRGNQRWVHLPVTICDALRAFGSEFSCLFPCRTAEREKEEKTAAAGDGGGNRHGTCGAVFARWLVAVQDGDGEKDIELVVEEKEEVEEGFKKPRRHVFEDLEIINDRIEGQKDESRMSVCVPPKNALLLMRCRSDPMKMEAFTTRSWEPKPTIDEEEVVEDQDHTQETPQENLESEHPQVMGLDQDQENQEHDHLQETLQQNQDQENVDQDEVFQQDQDQENVDQDEVFQDQDNVDQDQDFQDQDNVERDEVFQDQEQRDDEESMYLGFLFEEIVDQDSEMVESGEEDEDVLEDISETHKEKMENNGDLERESDVKEEREALPECLLMMMYEPKLSMEVSKETWVCSTDFIKRQSNKRKPPPPPLPPPPPAVEDDGGDESRVSVTANAATDYDLMRMADGGFRPVLQNPARSSCSFPAPPSMAAMLEQKLADAMGYEPFVLTRCKSEPMKTAAAKLLPESCVWENRKFKRLSGVAFGVGAAGLGF